MNKSINEWKQLKQLFSVSRMEELKSTFNWRKKISLATRNELSREYRRGQANNETTYPPVIQGEERGGLFLIRKLIKQLWEGPTCPRKTGLWCLPAPSSPSCTAINKLPHCLALLIPDVPASAFRNFTSFRGDEKGWSQGLGSWAPGPGPLGHVMSGKLTGILKPWPRTANLFPGMTGAWCQGKAEGNTNHSQVAWSSLKLS